MEKRVPELVQELSKYCFEKHISFLVESIHDKKGTNNIELIQDKQPTVKLTLYQSDDNDPTLANKIAEFLDSLKVTL